MRVEDLMTKDVKTCRPHNSLSRAAQLMWDHDCGCLPVTSADGTQTLVGMLSDRDICMAAFFHDKTVRQLCVKDAMAKPAFTCMPQDSIQTAATVMRDAGVRRLPVVDESGRLVGIISLADLARLKSHALVDSLAEALAAICEPRAHRGSESRFGRVRRAGNPFIHRAVMTGAMISGEG